MWEGVYSTPQNISFYIRDLIIHGFPGTNFLSVNGLLYIVKTSLKMKKL